MGGDAREAGIDLGRRAATWILAQRADDGSARPEPKINIDYIPGDGPGVWRQDPISKHPLAVGAYWGEVRPFVMTSGAQFRIPPPPALDSPEYAAAFDEVASLGGDGITTATDRTPDQTLDRHLGTGLPPSLCAPAAALHPDHGRDRRARGADLVDMARVWRWSTSPADAGIGITNEGYYKALASDRRDRRGGHRR